MGDKPIGANATANRRPLAWSPNAGHLTAGDIESAFSQGALSVRYQPIVSLATREVLAVEALLRLHHPVTGLLTDPHRFIPVAERTGSIIQLGAWVMRESCAEAARWQAPGRPVTVAVNVSAVQLSHPGFVDVVRSALTESGLPPARLCLELTETAALADNVHTLTAVTGLLQLGVDLAVDDFGVGHSSLRRLRRWPAGMLKLDRGFVGDLDSATGFRILRSLIGLARSLGLRTVAEGVESEWQAACLADLGCENAQGYLFGHPMRPDAMLERLA